MTRIFKGFLSLILIAGVIAGMILMVTELPTEAPITSLIKVNGGGALLFSVSLLILYIINNGNKDSLY